MQDIELHIEGPQANATVQSLRDAFIKAFGAAPQLQESPFGRSGSTQKEVATIGIITIILTIPMTLIAIMDLRERTRRKEPVAQLIELARKEYADRGTRIWVVGTNGRHLALDQAKPEDILDVGGSGSP